jgi:hypothetical protein|tara:strand:- start:28 stop:852 length:825 start_codon:yes stop_codon:yes gene_type:complete
MKTKHNKKRNTAFLYEALVKELTKTFISNELDRRDKVLDILKEHFRKGSVLHKELELYKALTDSHNLSPRVAERMLSEVKKVYFSFSKEEIFDEQTEVINKTNKTLGKSVFSNFVPNYKSLATISQIFSDAVPVKKRVVLEEGLIQNITAPKRVKKKENLVPIDNLVYKTFVDKFNKEYTGVLHEEQKTLLNNYIVSFKDNSLELKVYLNEELGRLKEEVTKCALAPEVKSDDSMANSVSSVLEMIEEFRTQPVNDKMVERVLKIQQLVREVQS